jgi:hypothetical protein
MFAGSEETSFVVGRWSLAKSHSAFLSIPGRVLLQHTTAEHFRHMAGFG